MLPFDTCPITLGMDGHNGGYLNNWAKDYFYCVFIHMR